MSKILQDAPTTVTITDGEARNLFDRWAVGYGDGRTGLDFPAFQRALDDYCATRAADRALAVDENERLVDVAANNVRDVLADKHKIRVIGISAVAYDCVEVVLSTLKGYK